MRRYKEFCALEVSAPASSKKSRVAVHSAVVWARAKLQQKLDYGCVATQGGCIQRTPSFVVAKLGSREVRSLSSVPERHVTQRAYLNARAEAHEKPSKLRVTNNTGKIERGVSTLSRLGCES